MNQDDPTIPIQQQNNKSINQIKINLNYHLAYDNHNHLNYQIEPIDKDSEPLEELNFRYEHFRTETFANFVHLNSPDSKESLYNCYSSSSLDESDDDHHHKSFRREVYEENFKAKIIKDKDEKEDLNESKLRKIFRRKLPERLSSTTNDLHSLLKKLSCLKRITSMVDINHNPTDTINDIVVKNKKKHRQLSYQNGKTLTKSDIVHCQHFKHSSGDHVDVDVETSQQLQQPLIVPKLCIEKISSPYAQSQTNPVIHFEEDNIRISHPHTNHYKSNHQHVFHLKSRVHHPSLSSSSDIEGGEDYDNQQKLIIPQSFSLSNFHPVTNLKQSFESLDKELADPQVEIPFEPNYRSISDCNFLEDSNLSFFLLPSSTVTCSTLTFDSDRNKRGKMIANQNSLNYFESKSNNSSQNPQNQPSYVNISRVNHGYVPYNRYTSEYRRDDSLLRGPARDEVDRYSTLPPESSKGFLHRKIESLYGETFADDWNRTRAKKGHSFDKCINSGGTESSLVNQIQSTLASSKLFQKIKSIDNSDLDHQSTSHYNNNLDKDWWLREHQINQNNSSHQKQDGLFFLNKLEEQKARLKNKIQQAEKWLKSSGEIPEESVGKIRVAIGKANLLLDKKFQQFQKLCEDSINQGDREEFKIQSDDLQGFWDMVMIQVNDVNQTFDQLTKLKQNQWKPIANLMDQTMLSTIVSNRPLSNSSTHSNNTKTFNSPRKSDNNNNNKTATNNSPRDGERQRILMETKRRGKMIMRNSNQNDDVDEIKIFAPK